MLFEGVTMMRGIAGVCLAVLLSGCGGESDDFTVHIKRSPDAVVSSLAKVDVSSPTALVSKPISRTLADGGIIEYSLPAADGYDNGIVRFTVTGGEKGGSYVAVMVDVPAVKGYVDGGQKVVAEDKVEKVLKEDLEALAANLESGSAGDFATMRLEASLISIAAVLQNISNGGLIPQGGSDDGATMLASGPGEGDWGAGEQEFVPDASPMSDPEADVSAYGEPMDDTAGYDDGGWGG
ncbi:hypothetical protein [Pontixanthobacter aquaemixtae]|uniref:Uncharacterized protein n=1 Tax=Pontixanthobacter aquaemixtae TaxID=1958940 RepID=A0A844ZVU0_9SPHN|nr:hypothetical protein [Pontixanthobacter aquaemixtae]MXO91382.1 hypothetical protein [Pontixanthobacter aquaemixtae]